jgi:hypothetical protein
MVPEMEAQIFCLGHGAISGAVSNFDQGQQVAKDDQSRAD